jgi:hypothetical protein
MAAVAAAFAALAVPLVRAHAASIPTYRQQVRDRPATPQRESWGTPIDGVQLRLAVAADASPYLPGQLPTFEVQLRNAGSGPVSYGLEAILFGDLEIDGVWYREAHAGSCCSSRQEIAAGTQGDTWPLRVIQTFVFELNARPARTLVLAAGKHSIRVRSVSNELYDIRTADGRGLALVSNPVEFDIPALSPAAERHALVEQTSAAGSRGLPAARTLVEKYPDAAIAALEAAVNATPDASLRSEYVRIVGMLPGEVPVPFLLSQLGSDAGLLSQLSAAEALLARGRFDWLPALLESWQNALKLPGSTPELDAEAQLISFLARSGNAEAIDALGQNARAPVDVRVAVIEAFLPPDAQPKTRASKGPSVSAMSRANLPTLPDGPAGAAIDRLLGAALDDREQRIGLSATYDDMSYEDPRVCDMAAFVFATRWPQKYRFTWPKTIAARDAEIEVIRRSRQPRDER